MPLPSIDCERRIQFCAGHRVNRHESCCAHLHGHNYVIYVKARAVDVNEQNRGLDGIGRVIDFRVLKEKLGGWIDAWWDHGFILDENDTQAIGAVKGMNGETFHQKLYLMPYNPTAENMAHYLLTAIGPEVLKGTGVELFEVRVEETENCAATARL